MSNVAWKLVTPDDLPTTAITTPNMLLASRDGLVFEGHLHSNGWGYASDKGHALPCAIACARVGHGPTPTDRITHIAPLPAHPTKADAHE
jgi:hypothetical protein